MRASEHTEPESPAPHPAELDDADLVRAAAAGRREAFDELVVRHRRAVYRLCYRLVGNHDDAADASQEVFLRAFRGLPRFKGDASIGTWLYRIGVNVCLNRLSVRVPPQQSPDVVELLPHPGQAPDAGLLAEERAARVRRAVLRLPGRQRATLVLRVYHELPHREIAAILGSSVGAVKANFFHALQNLRKILEGEREQGVP